jgi:hypothetical protein
LGTSVNQSSPRTVNWLAAHATYRDVNIPPHRAMVEVWRAATNQKTGDLAALLSKPIVAELGRLAGEVRSVKELWTRATALIARSEDSSLGSDIARRAAVQCIGATDRVQAYNERVFAEATSYLVSRDLPGFVGSGRARTAEESLQFKLDVMDQAARAARRVAPPSSFGPAAWSRHVARVVAELKGNPTELKGNPK